MNNNDFDISLLNSNPKKLVLKYLPVIKKLVFEKLINKGFFPLQDTEDLIQEVTERLLRDIEKIKSCYNGYSKFKPYFIRIITHKCNEIKRKQYKQETREVVNKNPDKPEFEKKVLYSRRYSYSRLDENQFSGNNQTDKKIVLESELDRLEVIFRMYPLQGAKLKLCLKLLTGRGLTTEELECYYDGCESSIYSATVDYSQNINAQTKEKGYEILAMFFNCCENKNRGNDSIRKWINKLLQEIVEQMNFVSIPPVYNKENIMGLIELYFEKMHKNNS